jgi:hypothetical protein
MKRNGLPDLPLPLELTTPEPTDADADLASMLGATHERHKRSNSQCVNYGLIQIDDVQIDEIDLF